MLQYFQKQHHDYSYWFIINLIPCFFTLVISGKVHAKVPTDNVIVTLFFWPTHPADITSRKALTRKSALKYTCPVCCLTATFGQSSYLCTKIVIHIMSVWQNVAFNHKYTITGLQWNHIWITGSLLLTKLDTKLGI